MSSPSPGKRRMDTDVIKLYPCWIYVRKIRFEVTNAHLPRANRLSLFSQYC